jgi:hypothetical protein
LHDAFGYAPVMAIAAGVEIIAMTVMLVGRASKQARDTEFVLFDAWRRRIENQDASSGHDFIHKRQGGSGKKSMQQ